LQKLICFLIITFSCLDLIAQKAQIQQLVDSVSISMLKTHLDSLCWAGGHQSRITYTEGNYHSAGYIASCFASLPGISRVELDTFYIGLATPPYNTVSYPLINVTAYLEGESANPEVITVGAHYDASASNDPNYNIYWNIRKAQGADDNASGVAAILEIARVLSDPDNGYIIKNTIKFIALAAEEYHPKHSAYHHRGSLYDASQAEQQGLNLAAVIILDMIAYNPVTDYIEVISDLNSLWLADTLLSCAGQYVPDLLTNDYPLPNVPYSDHESYQSHGYPAILLMENDSPWNDDLPNYTNNPFYHTQSDTIGTIRFSQLEKVAKLGLAASAVLAERENITFINREQIQQSEKNSLSVNVFPNPFNSQTTISFHLSTAENVSIKLYNLLGQQVADIVNDRFYTAGSNKIIFNGANLSTGTYFISISSNGMNEKYKILIIK